MKKQNLRQRAANGIAYAGIGIGSLVFSGCTEILAAKMLLDDNTKSNFDVNPQNIHENIYYPDGTAYIPLLTGSTVYNGPYKGLFGGDYVIRGTIKTINGRSTWEEHKSFGEIVSSWGIELLDIKKIPLTQENLYLFSFDRERARKLSHVIQWGRD